MQAPDISILLSNGQTVPLASLFETQPLALVFLRHLGCVFCREHVAQLRGLKDANIVFVSMGSPEQTEAFRSELSSPHRYICDPERVLYHHFGVRRGGLVNLLHPQVFIRGIGAAMSQGMQAKPQSDPMQLPGVVVIDTTGDVTWEHQARHAADNPSGEEILRHLNPSLIGQA